MNRRIFLHLTIASFAMGGCLGTDGGGFGSDTDDEDDTEDDTDTTDDSDENIADDDEDGEDDNSDTDDLRHELEESFEERWVDVIEVQIEDEEISLEMQTSGNFDTDISNVAGVYASLSPQLERNLTVRVEDRGLTAGTFEIELEWAQDFLNGELDDQAYLDLIEETRTD